MLTVPNHVAPAPRRVRGYVGEMLVFDTTAALYVWEVPYYPFYYVPRTDVRAELVNEGEPRSTAQGMAQSAALHVGEQATARAARVVVSSDTAALAGTVRFRWDAIDRWFEEDEEIFVHPRNPYVRVDAIRSRRSVRVSLGGVVLAESAAPVMVYETGLPTRYYLDATDVRFAHLVPSPTRTECPYKGRVTGYWSARIGEQTIPDIAWQYAFPTRQLLPIAGLVAYLDEKVDIALDGVAQERPVTHMR